MENIDDTIMVTKKSIHDLRIALDQGDADFQVMQVFGDFQADKTATDDDRVSNGNGRNCLANSLVQSNPERWSSTTGIPQTH